MAKFNKDTFLKSITDKVQTAIDKNLITKEDIENNDLDRLHRFLQYELLEYVDDRKFAIDVLRDFNYDEKAPWVNLQAEYGVFKSLMDIALVNLWKFIQSEGFDKYSGYSLNHREGDKPLLDTVHDMEDMPEEQGVAQEVAPTQEIGFDAINNNNVPDFTEEEPEEDIEPEKEPESEEKRFAPRRRLHVDSEK